LQSYALFLGILVTGSLVAGLGADLELQKAEYGVPSVDRQRREAYPDLLFRHFSLNGTDIELGARKIEGSWRSVWESYQNSREVRNGYHKGRPVFTRKILPIKATDISRRLSSSAGGVSWPAEAEKATSADGVSYVIIKRLDSRAYAVMNDQIIYITFAQYYPSLRRELQLPELE
jgi:hypothetical protein